MYSFIILFFTLPLYFSHVFSPFGLIIWDVSSFERQKIYFFVVLILMACVEWCIRFSDLIWNTLKKYGYIFFVAIMLPFFSAMYFQDSIGRDFFIGSHEKNHGYIFYVTCIIFFILLHSTPIEYFKKYFSWSIISAVLVACIAIGEHMGWISDIYGRFEMASLYPGRSSSTLGNPNYLAGYLIPFIPILIANIKKEKHIMQIFFNITALAVIVLGIYMSWSYIAWILVWLLIIWYHITLLFRRYSLSKQIFIFAIITSVLIFLWFSLIDPLKLLSFESRFILMKESIMVIIQHPISLVFWFGPESLLSYFSYTRSIFVNQYFPESMLIDSSHNIFIDILFQYGIIPIYFFIYCLYLKGSHLRSSIGLSIILLSIFLMFNVFVVSHIIVLFLFIIYLLKNKKVSL